MKTLTVTNQKIWTMLKFLQTNKRTNGHTDKQTGQKLYTPMYQCVCIKRGIIEKKYFDSHLSLFYGVALFYYQKNNCQNFKSICPVIREMLQNVTDDGVRATTIPSHFLNKRVMMAL